MSNNFFEQVMKVIEHNDEDYLREVIFNAGSKVVGVVLGEEDEIKVLEISTILKATDEVKKFIVKFVSDIDLQGMSEQEVINKAYQIIDETILGVNKNAS